MSTAWFGEKQHSSLNLTIVYFQVLSEYQHKWTEINQVLNIHSRNSFCIYKEKTKIDSQQKEAVIIKIGLHRKFHKMSLIINGSSSPDSILLNIQPLVSKIRFPHFGRDSNILKLKFVAPEDREFGFAIDIEKIIENFVGKSTHLHTNYQKEGSISNLQDCYGTQNLWHSSRQS